MNYEKTHQFISSSVHQLNDGSAGKFAQMA
jgi:hypothetical protein